jgi:hypothetical protein
VDKIDEVAICVLGVVGEEWRKLLLLFNPDELI